MFFWGKISFKFHSLVIFLVNWTIFWEQNVPMKSHILRGLVHAYSNHEAAIKDFVWERRRKGDYLNILLDAECYCKVIKIFNKFGQQVPPFHLAWRIFQKCCDWSNFISRVKVWAISFSPLLKGSCSCDRGSKLVFSLILLQQNFVLIFFNFSIAY